MKNLPHSSISIGKSIIKLQPCQRHSAVRSWVTGTQQLVSPSQLSHSFYAVVFWTFSSMSGSSNKETFHSFSIKNNQDNFLVRFSSNHHLAQVCMNTQQSWALVAQAIFRLPPCCSLSLWESWEYNFCLLNNMGCNCIFSFCLPLT